MEKFDLIVVGSGPCGSAAAVTARRAGLRVAIVDKAVFPRDKLCGGLFTGRSQKAMGRIFEVEVDEDLFLASDHMRFLSDGEVLADIPDAPRVYLTMRRDFDHMLHDAAVSAGAEPYLGQPATDLSGGVVTLKDGTQLGYRALIGADGVNSFVAKHLFGRSFDPDTIGFGLEIETPQTDARDDAVEVDFDAARWGYGWSFPKHKSVTVGVGGINSKNANMKAQMKSYVDLTRSDGSLRYKGQYLPFGDFKKQPGRENILLAGDAAGLVDPITGEGIALALESGDHAAQAVVQALSDARPETAMVYYMRALKPIHRSLKEARIWRLVMFPDATHLYFKKAFKRRGDLQMQYLRLLAGELDYRDIRGALVKRVPKLLWRFARHGLGLTSSKTV